MSSRIKLPQPLDKLLRSEMKTVIAESRLGAEDTIIAERCIIDRWAQIDIAAEVNCDRSTISRRMPEILAQLLKTAERLGMI